MQQASKKCAHEPQFQNTNIHARDSTRILNDDGCETHANQSTETPDTELWDATTRRVPGASQHASTEDSELGASCPICLDSTMDDRSLLDSCFHAFCFTCISEWAKQSMTCPLCKSSFRSVIHNILSNIEYDTTDLSANSKRSSASSHGGARHGYRDATRAGSAPAYRHPHTSVLSGGGTTAARIAASGETQWSSAEQLLGVRPGSRSAATVALRRAIYMHNGSLRPIDFGRHKPRDVTAKAFRSQREGRHVRDAGSRSHTGDNEDSPAMRRLRPWLHREMLILAGHNPDHVWFLETTIEGLLKQGALVDRARMYRELEPFLFRNTGRFISELLAFASSPWDMLTWDQAAHYDFPSASAPRRPARSTPAQVTQTPALGSTTPLPATHHSVPESRESRVLPQPVSRVSLPGEWRSHASDQQQRAHSLRHDGSKSARGKRRHGTTTESTNGVQRSHTVDEGDASAKQPRTYRDDEHCAQMHDRKESRRRRPCTADRATSPELISSRGTHATGETSTDECDQAGRGGTRLEVLVRERNRIEQLLRTADNALLAMRLRSVNAEIATLDR
eukprot:m.887074 g.887074  ORF g.887074 m.887074 type:complete len:565 (-) comp23634_c0_seq3:2256-3950(-)